MEKLLLCSLVLSLSFDDSDFDDETIEYAESFTDTFDLDLDATFLP